MKLLGYSSAHQDSVSLIPNNTGPTFSRKRKRGVCYVTRIRGNPNLNLNECVVLKSARALYFQKTQALYNSIYPNAPKSQIKTIVATHWEISGQQEKQVYISQALAKLGYPQTNLTNPELSVASTQAPSLNGQRDIPLPMFNSYVQTLNPSKRLKASDGTPIRVEAQNDFDELLDDLELNEMFIE